jgi:uncharacterized membrane protein
LTMLPKRLYLHYMSDQDHHTKNKFQVERIAFFSDAVFAIAITLMIIEVKPPHLEKGASFTTILNIFLHVLPMFLGVIMSFFLIGIFWRRHHQLFRHVVAYDDKFILMNLGVLSAIIFIPFTTAFTAENLQSGSMFPLVLYNVNFMIASLLNYRLFRYTLNPKNNLAVHIPETKESKVLFRELLYPNLVYLFVIGLSFFGTFAPIGYAAFSLEGVVTRIGLPKK